MNDIRELAASIEDALSKRPLGEIVEERCETVTFTKQQPRVALKDNPRLPRLS